MLFHFECILIILQNLLKNRLQRAEEQISSSSADFCLEYTFYNSSAIQG